MQSTGKGSRLALTLAKGAAFFSPFEADPKTKGYFAGFRPDAADFGRLLALMPLVHLWRGTVLFLQGRPTRYTHEVQRTLECFIRANGHPAPKEYCPQMRDIGRNPFGFSLSIRLPGDLPPEAPPELPKILLPCRLLGATNWRFDQDAPSLQSQVQSEALARDVAWCPFFDAARTRYYPPG